MSVSKILVIIKIFLEMSFIHCIIIIMKGGDSYESYKFI